MGGFVLVEFFCLFFVWRWGGFFGVGWLVCFVFFSFCLALVPATEKTKYEGDRLGYIAFVFWFFQLLQVCAMNPVAVCPEEVALYYLQPCFAC